MNTDATEQSKPISLMEAAGRAFVSENMRRELVNQTEQENASIRPSGLNTSEHHKKQKRDEKHRTEQMMSLVAGTTAALSIGGFSFTAQEVGGALNDARDFNNDMLNISQSLQDAHQHMYLRNQDGALMSAEQIKAYEDDNRVCVANPYTDAQDIADLQAQGQAIDSAANQLALGGKLTPDMMPPSVSRQLIQDKIQAKLDAGEDIDLSKLPPDYQDVAIDTMINNEIPQARLAVGERLGLTPEQMKAGAPFTDGYDDMRKDFMNGMNDWESARRAELGAAAGKNYVPETPKPSAPAQTADASPTPADNASQQNLTMKQPPPADTLGM